MSKRANIRRNNNKGGFFYLRYTEDIEKELYTLISSLPNITRLRWVKPQNLMMCYKKS